MYHIGDFVVKANEGICKIEDINYLDIPNVPKDKMYMLLVPVENPSVKVYLPVDGAGEKLRDVITEEEAGKLIKRIPDIKAAEITDEKQREKMYKDAVLSSNPEQLVAVIKTIYDRKIKRENQGKKTGSVDERFFKVAEEKLYAELAFAMKKHKDEMKQFIIDAVGGK